jgi:hypothetical protein
MQTPTLAGHTYDKNILSRLSTEVEFAGAVLVHIWQLLYILC